MIAVPVPPPPPHTCGTAYKDLWTRGEEDAQLGRGRAAGLAAEVKAGGVCQVGHTVSAPGQAGVGHGGPGGGRVRVLPCDRVRHRPEHRLRVGIALKSGILHVFKDQN